MTKCIAKTLPSKEQGISSQYHSGNVSQGNISVTLNSIRRDSKSDSNCFLFKILVDGKDAGEFTILDESNLDKIAYQGNIGAEVYPAFNGNRVAEKVLYMLLPFCKERGLSKLMITTDPDNEAIIKTCSNLSAKYLDTLKADNENTEKLRYIFSGF